MKSRFAPLWPLDPAVDYLNHGSFGACPTAILDYQDALRRELEREPADFLWRGLSHRLREAREAVGAFVGADPDDLAFVRNATAGVNAVVRSLEWRPGDEIVTTDHAYAACRKTLEYATRRTGARVVVAAVPFPLSSESEIVDAVLGAVTPRTRLALLDHVSSPTALVYPISRLVEELSARGVDTLVDGAHALGMVPLALEGLGAAYWTGNAHKWLCAPKGAAILYVRRDRQEAIHPSSISHGFDPDAGRARFRAEFDWTGTEDPTPYLSLPECFRYLGSLLPGGWPEIMTANRCLALSACAVVGEAVGMSPSCPETMVGAMASIPLPRPAPGSPAETRDFEQLMNLFREQGAETWLSPRPDGGGLLVRVSAQLYNHEAQYARLAGLLREAFGVG